MTALIAKGIDTIPGLHLRASDQAEALGMDEDQIGEFANDYIEVRRDFDDWTPPTSVRKSWAKDRTASQTTSEETTGPAGHVAAGDRHGRPDFGVPTQKRQPSKERKQAEGKNAENEKTM